MSTVVNTSRARTATRLAAGPTLAADAGTLESASPLRRLAYLVSAPYKNFLLPSSWLLWLMRRSKSPLVADALLKAGSWRSMEITYRNDEPVDWIDRQALRTNPIAMAARNRRQIVTARLSALIARYGETAPVTVLGVGAGPGRHVQTAIVDSGIDPTRVTAYLIDRDDDAFEYGRALATRLEIAGRIHFIKGDALRIRETLPDVAAQVVKVIGLAEYLNDVELVALLRALRDVMTPDGSLVTHGLVDVYRTARFLARVFNLRHYQRNERQMTTLLEAAGFRTLDCITEPMGIHPILTAVPDRRR